MKHRLSSFMDVVPYIRMPDEDMKAGHIYMLHILCRV
jgi:hypothetical protein